MKPFTSSKICTIKPQKNFRFLTICHWFILHISLGGGKIHLNKHVIGGLLNQYHGRVPEYKFYIVTGGFLYAATSIMKRVSVRISRISKGFIEAS
jgi:hypothetical protein